MHQARNPLSPDLDRTLFYLLDRCSSLFLDAVAQRLKSYKLNPRQYAVLCLVAQRGKSNQQDLADEISVNRNAMVQIIDHLEQFSYASREVNRFNRRENMVTITDKGKKTVESARRAIEDFQKNVLPEIDDQEREQMIHCLQRFRTSLEAHREGVAAPNKL